MKTFLLFTGSSPLVILTSHSDIRDPALLKKLQAKGINKFIAHELSVETAKERYGGHFGVVLHDMRETDDLRVLDYNGQRAFDLFRLDELGSPILYDAKMKRSEAA